MSKGGKEQEDAGLSPRCFKRLRTGIQATQEEGYRVVSMSEAESATGYLEDSNPDLIVLDLSPNGFDAWGVLQDIRGKGHHLPVLIRITTLDNTQ